MDKPWSNPKAPVLCRLMNPRSSAAVLLDFDGTITLKDCDLMIADALLGTAAGHMYGPLVRAYEGLEIGAAEYFEGYLSGLGAAPGEIAAKAGEVPLRPGFRALVEWCRARGMSVRVLSEGLRLYIEPLMAAAGVGDLPVSANEVRCDGAGRFTVTPPPDAEPCNRCLNCKGAHVRRLQAAGHAVAIVGNGASDLCAARVADLVVARDGLLRHCRNLNISCVVWETFSEVRSALEEWRFQPAQPE